MGLRPYQQEACEAVLGEWQKGNRKTLLVLPTGTGKTVVFSKVAENRVRHGDRVLILAHRGELLEQAEQKIQHFTGLGCALEKADATSVNSYFRITVGSVQTMMRQSRLQQYPKNYFGTVIVDEAHHVIAQSYQNILDYFSDASVLGVTATPDRSDRKNLGTYFDSLAYEYSLPQAIKEGYLCKIVAQTVPLAIDITNVGIAAGDYKAGELGDALEPYLEKIADEMLEYCKDRKTVVFLPLVATSQKFRDILLGKGIAAAEINGNSEDRAEILKDFESGKYQVLCNAMLLTEGWDCPSVDCIICLRATKSRSLYSQIVGRGLRPFPGKENCLLLDFLWMTERHELVRPAHLIAKNEELAKKMTEKMAQGELYDIEELEEEVERDAVQEREQKLAEELRSMRRRKRKLVDPLQYEMSIMDEDLVNYEPSFAWEMGPASAKQLQALEKFGIFTDSIECAGKASMLLDRLIKRKENGLTTPKQIRFLENKGFQHVGTWAFGTASKMIARIAANNWMVPWDIDPEEYVPEA